MRKLEIWGAWSRGTKRCAISSVVERLLHTQEVAGSNPASRISFFVITASRVSTTFFGCVILRWLLLLHFDGAGRCWVLSGGWVSGYGVMLGFRSVPLLVLSSLPFHFVLERFLLFVLLCLVAHIRDPKADTTINKVQRAK